MPVLKNARHEKFAQALAAGVSATEAYTGAGYKGDRTAASRLSTNVNVVKRVEELQARVAEKAEWTAADRLLALKGIFAKTAGDDPRVAISAIAEANKMQGSYAPTKAELTGKGGGPIQTVDLSKVSDEQLDALEAIFGPLATASGDDEGDKGGEGEESGSP